MNEQVGVIEPDTATEDKGDEAAVDQTTNKTLERTRSYSIVKPPQERKISGEEDGEALEEVDETLVADDKSDRTNIQDVWQEEGGDKTKVVKYTDIRSKFPHLLKEKSPGVAKTLFHQDSTESQLSEQVRVYIEGESRGGSELRDLSETSAKSVSSESLEILESLPESPEKSVKDTRLPTLEEVTPVESEQPDLLKPMGTLTLEDRSNSRANLEK